MKRMTRKQDRHWLAPPAPATSEADCNDLHIAYLHGQQREKERNREAVKELAEALQECASKLESQIARNHDLPQYYREVVSKAFAALAKHGTQAAAPDHVEDGLNMVAPSWSELTAYGEKVREAAANMLAERANSKRSLIGLPVCQSEIIQRDRAEQWDEASDAIRSMPLPAQSEGEEK